MLNTKRISLFFSSLLLIISLVSVSGFAPVLSNYETPKTELVNSISTIENASVAQYKSPTKTHQTVIYNQFMVFNFKCLLNIHYFDISLTFKSQKEATLKFLEYQLLEQNLIAQINTSNYKNSFIN